jgi:hypothetical protein
MSPEYYRRGKNWFSAIGLLFIIMAGIVLGQQLYLWGPEFVGDFIISSELTNEKVSLAMIAFGTFMIMMGLRKNVRAR